LFGRLTEELSINSKLIKKNYSKIFKFKINIFDLKFKKSL